MSCLPLSLTARRPRNVPGRPWLLFWLLASVFAVGAAGRVVGDELDVPLSAELQRIYFTGVPETRDDLRLMDRHQQALVERVTRFTVGLQIGPTQGSGVVVSQDGYVLTAAHVAGRAGLDVSVLMPDGRKLRGKTLGMHKGMDAALVQLDMDAEDAKNVQWPHAEMGRASDLRPGSWCLALGHPGGYQIDRAPVARFGRVLSIHQGAITTDCKLVGGDSGGPLFDMQGRVIGIHSRIGSQITKNVHVPIDAYHDHWTRLARGDSWGTLLAVVGRPVIGVLGDKSTEDAKIMEVLPGSPAERAGVQPGDLVTRLDDARVDSFDHLRQLVGQKQPGDEVTLEVLRDGERRELRVILAAVSYEEGP